MAGKIEVTASVLIALASLTAGHALAATNTLDAVPGVDNIGTKAKSMASGTMLDGYAVLKPSGLSGVQIAQAQPAEGQPDPNLLLKQKHPAEAEKPEPQHEKPAQPPAQAAPKPPVEAPKPHVEAPKPPAEAPRPPAEAKEPPAARPAPQPVPHAPEPVKPPAQPKSEPKPEPAPAAPEAQKPKVREPAPEAPKPEAAPKPQHEKPAQPPAAAAPKEPTAAKPAPEPAPEPVKPPQKHSEPMPPKAEQAPAPVAPPAEKPAPAAPKPSAGAPQLEAPAVKPEGKRPAPAAEKPAEAPAPSQPTPAAPPAAGRPVDPGKAVTPPAAAPAGEAPMKQRPPKPNQPDAPVPQGAQPPAAPAPASVPGTPPPVPPAPAPGDAAKAPTAILPPLNTVQSSDPAQPAQGGQPGQGGPAGKPPRPGQPGQAGQAGQPGAPSQVPEAARPQFSQEQQQPFTPKELQRLKALAARPDQSNDTIVLPVDNGAPVLDSDKDANWRRGMSEDQLRRMRKQSAQDWNYAVPQSDEQAQREYFGNRQRPAIVMESIDQYQGRRLQKEPQFLYPDDVRAGQQFDDDRRVMDYDGQIVVRGDDNRRFEQFGRPVVYEQVDHQRVRETVFKQNGDRIVSLRNRYGQLIQRSRVDADGREVVLFYSPDLYAADDSRPVVYRDPGASMPPMRLRVPLNDYIVDVGSQPDRDYYDFIEQPPVEPVERVYTIDEVRNSARIRDKMRRIDLDTITFATGSWDISMNQAGTLKKVADAISKVLKNNPAETFLIEGHTDAVGSAESNLVLSDRRAEAVANVLTQVYGIAPENMVTQGYGEQFLKVMTYGPEQQNRRVTIRRVTPLVRPVQ